MLTLSRRGLLALLILLPVYAPALDEVACRLYYARLAAGDPNAFEELFPAIDPDLKGFIYSRVRDREATDDIAQEVYLVVWKGKTLPSEQFKASDWILAIAKNKIRQYYQARGKRPPPRDRSLIESVAARPVEGTSSDKVYSHLEQELTQALRQNLFSSENLKLLDLNREGAPFSQIVKETGTTLSRAGVSVRLSTLRKTLDSAVAKVPATLEKLLSPAELTLYRSALEGTAPNDPETTSHVMAIHETLCRHLLGFGLQGADARSAMERERLAKLTLTQEAYDIWSLTEMGISAPEVIRRLGLPLGDTGVQANYQRSLTLLRLATNEADRVTTESFSPAERDLLRLDALGFSPAHLKLRLGLEETPERIADRVTALRERQRALHEIPGAVAVDRRTFATAPNGAVVESPQGKGLGRLVEEKFGEPRASLLKLLEAGLSYDEAKALTGIDTENRALSKAVDRWRRELRAELEKNLPLAQTNLDRLTSDEREILELLQQKGGEKLVRDRFGAPWTNLYLWHRAHQIREKLR